jgi:ABC-type sugar transport system ATPase subunit
VEGSTLSVDPAVRDTQATGAATPPVLAARRVSKRYGSVRALSGVDLEIRPGELVGLVGDNGAGKSTLLQIFSGAIQPNGGEILFDGKPVRFGSPIEARMRGIEAVYQDLSLAPDLSVWANLFLGRERKAKGLLGKLGWLDRRAMTAEAQADLERTGIRIGSVHAQAGRLSGGQRQAVEVGRAVAWGSRILLMDEPTAALGVEQQAAVGDLMQAVAAKGIAVLLISHNLPQVHAICDRIVVLFHGRTVADLKPSEASVDEIVRWITGVAIVRSGR